MANPLEWLGAILPRGEAFQPTKEQIRAEEERKRRQRAAEPQWKKDAITLADIIANNPATDFAQGFVGTKSSDKLDATTWGQLIGAGAPLLGELKALKGVGSIPVELFKRSRKTGALELKSLGSKKLPKAPGPGQRNPNPPPPRTKKIAELAAPTPPPVEVKPTITVAPPEPPAPVVTKPAPPRKVEKSKPDPVPNKPKIEVTPAHKPTLDAPKAPSSTKMLTVRLDNGKIVQMTEAEFAKMRGW